MRFWPTHEIRLTGYKRRGHALLIPVMVDVNGAIWTREEWRTRSRERAWSFDGTWRGPVPDGYTTMKVRRLAARRRAARGRTSLRAGAEPTRSAMTVRMTASEIATVTSAAIASGKRRSVWAREVLIEAARGR